MLASAPGANQALFYGPLARSPAAPAMRFRCRYRRHRRPVAPPVVGHSEPRRRASTRGRAIAARRPISRRAILARAPAHTACSGRGSPVSHRARSRCRQRRSLPLASRLVQQRRARSLGPSPVATGFAPERERLALSSQRLPPRHGRAPKPATAGMRWWKRPPRRRGRQPRAAGRDQYGHSQGLCVASGCP